MRKMLVGALGTMLLALPTLSSAIPMTWTYSGTCTWGDCADVPSISGTLSGDPALHGPSNELNEWFVFGDLTSYSFNVGSYSFSGSSALGTYLLDAAGNIVGGSLTFGNVLALEFLGIGSATWSIVDQDWWWTDVEAGGSGGYTNTSVAVPEPGTLGLFGLMLLGVGAASRRRKVK